MSENKKPFSPWIPTVILGVVTILFSFYALQSQTDTLADEKRIEELEREVTTLKREAEQQRQAAEEQSALAAKAVTDCEAAKKQAEEDCRKISKRK